MTTRSADLVEHVPLHGLPETPRNRCQNFRMIDVFAEGRRVAQRHEVEAGGLHFGPPYRWSAHPDVMTASLKLAAYTQEGEQIAPGAHSCEQDLGHHNRR